MAMPSFTCASCNQLHDGLPELAVPEPYFVGCLDPVAKANVERLGTEKEFGAGLLRLVVKASPRSKAAGAAKNKLKSAGAD